MTEPAQKPGLSQQNYRTPVVFLQAVLTRLGIAEFMFDFAADAANAVATCYWDEDVNALVQDADAWANCVHQPYATGWGWLNPPFARIAPWLALVWAATRWPNVRIAVLLPAGVGSDWWKNWVHGHCQVLLLNGRLCFIDDWATTMDPATLKPGKGPARCYTAPPLYPKDCVLLLYAADIAPGYEIWNWRG